MEHLQQGAEAFVHGNGFSAQIKVHITPPAEFAYEIEGVEQHVMRAQTVYARGFNGPGQLTIRPVATTQFVTDAQAHIVVELKPETGHAETVELQRFKIAGLSEFTPLHFTPQPGGLLLKSGQVEQLASEQSRVYSEIIREITPEEELSLDHASGATNEPRSVLVYVDQSSSMENASRPEQIRAVAKFLAEFLSKLEIELSVAGSSLAQQPKRVSSSSAAQEAILALTPRSEVGWPRSLNAALKDYDRVVVISDDIPAEVENPRVTLVNLDHLPQRFDGIEVGPRIVEAVENDNHTYLRNLSEYLRDRLYLAGVDASGAAR